MTDEVYGLNGSSTAVTSHRDYYANSGFVQDIQSGTGSSTGVGTGSSLQNLHYTWLQLGNLQDRQDNRQGLNGAFQYDPLNRLTSAQVTNGVGTQPAVTYGYDALGNLTCKSDVLNTACNPTSGGYTYGGSAGPHAVTATVPGSVYGYDADGNMTNRNGTTLGWNSDNLPTQITQDANNQSTFSYAPDKHRYYQTAKNGGITETTVYAGGLEIVTNGSGTHNRYQLTAYGRSIAIVDLETNAGGAVANTQYLLTDNLGSVDGATDANGALVTGTGWSFGAFGGRRNPATWQGAASGTQVTADRVNGTSNGVSSGVTNRGYTGHEMLDNVGLVHMNGRVYDPSLGRFLSVDPVFQFPTNTQSLNPYSYVLNNPLSATDPTGYTENCTAGQTTGCPPEGQDKSKEYGSNSGESSRIHEGHEGAAGQHISSELRQMGGLIAKFANAFGKELTGALTSLKNAIQSNGASILQGAFDGQNRPTSPSGINSPSNISKQQIPYTQDEKDLASILQTEASEGSGQTDADRQGVANTVVNFMKWKRVTSVDALIHGKWKSTFQHQKAGDDDDLKLARQALSGTLDDNTAGAVHFYTPLIMPTKDQVSLPRFKGYDIGGGLTNTPGLPEQHYQPSWANKTDKFTERKIPGGDPTEFRFYGPPQN